MSPQQIQQQLKTMKGKSFKYDGHVHTVKDFSIDKDSGKFNVKTDRLEFTRKFSLAAVFFESFKPVTEVKEEKKINGNVSAAVSKNVSTADHAPSSVIVYSTMNYSWFRMINGNRGINLRKINKIVREIEKGNDMLRYYPIQVAENKDRLDILDGQHRFFIDKKLKRPVYYILVEEEKTMPDIATVNSNVETWKPKDYINLHVQEGNRNYIELDDFLKTYKISSSISMKMLATGKPGTEGTDQSLNEKFRSGIFEVKQKEKAIELAEQCQRFQSFSKWRDRGFIIAIYRIREAGLISLDDLFQAFSKRPEMLTGQRTFKDYIWNFEQIVNVGKQKRIVIV